MAGEQQRLKEYLLGQLTEAEEEQVELRLLNEPDFAEEYDMVVDELTDDYVAGKLSGNEREQMEQHFFRSSERRSKLKFAQALKTRKAELNKDKLPKPNSWFRPLMAIAASLVVLVGGSYIWRIQSGDSQLDQGLAALHSAFRDERPLEARLSDLDYAPYSTTRGPGTGNVDQDELYFAELTLRQALKTNPTPAVHHALGKVFLAKKQFDDALKEFDEAVKGDPKNAQFYSDLGAAWLEKGKLNLNKAPSDPTGSLGGNAVIELARSLDNIDKALALTPDLPEALFNRALYHQYMRLREQEESDWHEYLKRDPTSQWASEARRRLKLIEEQRKELSQSREEKLENFVRAFRSKSDGTAWTILSSSHNRSGNIVVEQLVDAYLTNPGRQENDEATQNLLLLSYAGNLEKERANDLFFSDLGQFYRQTGPAEQATLRRARALMKSTHEGWGKARVEESLNLLNEAKRLFEQADNFYESIVADYWISFCYYRQNDQKQSLAILEPLLTHCESKSYNWLLARLFYLMSGIQFKLNEHSRAIEFATRAAELAERTSDKVGFINALGSLMEFHRYLGNHQKALSYVQRGFGVVDSIALDPVQGTRHYGFEATAFASAGLFAASADFQRIALGFAVSSGLNAAISASYSFLSLTNSKLGRYDEALRNSRLAYDIASAHSIGPDDQNLMAYASLQMGNASRLAGDLTSAVAHYSRSIEIYRSLNMPTHLYQAHKGRLLCYIAGKNDDLAKAEISTAITLVEKYRTKIFEANNRDNFFDAEQNVYDTAIDFEYSRMQNVDQAFQYSEDSRARSLLDLVVNDSLLPIDVREPGSIVHSLSQPLSLTEIKLRLPKRVRLVQYAVLENRLLIWVISTDGIQAFPSNITESELTQKVLAYSKAMSRKPGLDMNESKLAAQELFNILIGPIASLLGDDRQLCIVPDKVLHFLPFAALISPSGRYLIQDYVLQTSPSSSVFIRCSEIADDKKELRHSERALSVGNPTFDRDAYPLFPDLPTAAREAREVAKFYATSKPLIEHDATEASVKTEMKNFEVIHFALHSVLDEQFPLHSRLLLARTKQPATDSLSALDVYGMRLTRTRLVVLSSCQTGVERYYKGEGMISLARPFIAARVPLVVASLWPVESDSTAELMISFHKHRTQKKASTAAALAAAQREMLGSSDERYRHPYYWAPFLVIGGYAEF